jgi:hypothetical protein
MLFISSCSALNLDVEESDVYLSFNDNDFEEYKIGFYEISENIEKICIKDLSNASLVFADGNILLAKCTTIKTKVDKDNTYNIKKISGLEIANLSAKSVNAVARAGSSRDIKITLVDNKNNKKKITITSEDELRLPKQLKYLYININNYSSNPRVFLDKKKIKIKLISYKKNFNLIKINANFLKSNSTLSIYDREYSSKLSFLEVYLIKE